MSRNYNQRHTTIHFSADRLLGGCFDAEFVRWSNGLMQDFRVGHLKPVISAVVAAEIADAPGQVQELYIEVLTLNAEIVNITEQAIDLADVYQQRGILTPKFYNDGLHIALATVAEVDLLVSWNFKHVVHVDKIRLFNAVNLEYGYRTIQIYSPREVTSYGED